MPGSGTPVFPFSAIVGQERLKLALLLNAVDPGIGGVLIRGEKGTAKSTAVRALSAVMPTLAVVEGCRFSCDPAAPASWCDECRARRTEGALTRAERLAQVVELPVSATEDRLVGTIDLEHALRTGEKRFEPGLLARANRSILYVDEVNLLDDHLVDTLLDAAATGVNIVEREGVSFRHPARFILVGTMNPEEGELRPQLLDRFGLCVDVQGERDPESRVEIVRRRRDFDRDPKAFAEAWADEESALRTRLRRASVLVQQVAVPDELLYAIANLALTVGVDGHRADQAMARAAAAHAALHGRDAATLSDVGVVAPFVLAHRTKRTLFDEPRLDSSALATLIGSVLATSEHGESSETEETGNAASVGAGQVSIWDSEADTAVSEESPGDGVRAELSAASDRMRRSAQGRTQQATSADSRGRYSRSRPGSADTAAGDVALDATLRSAASTGGRVANPDSDLAISVRPDQLHEKVRTRKVGASVVFCVDTSGSMGAVERLSAARSAIVELLTDAYQRRDRVAVVTFRGEGASVVLAPTASVQLAQLRLRDVPTGGATPLAAGLLASLELLQREMRRDPDTVPWLVLVTDGRANVGIEGGSGSGDAVAAARRVRDAGIHMLFVDAAGSGAGSVQVREIVSAAGATYVGISDGGHKLGTILRSRMARKF